MTRPYISVTLILIMLIACLSLPAYASQPYTASYKLTASSPVDDHSTSAIEASPGTPITITATATGTYNGPFAVPLPSFTVNLQYDLKRGSNVVDTKKDSYKINAMMVQPGKTYTQTGSKTYTLPSNLAPGEYTLYCTATASVLGVGRTEHASFTIKVVTDARIDHKPVKDTPPSSCGGNTGSCDMWHCPSFS